MIEENGIQDWLDYCNGKSVFDKSHFHTLFHQKLSLENIDQIFHFFERGNDLKSRFLAVYHTGHIYANPHPTPNKSQASKEDMIKICRKIMEEKIRFMQELKETEAVQILEGLEIKFTDNHKLFEQQRMIAPHSNVIDIINDYFIFNKNSEEKKVYAIQEAFYGLAADFELEWYLSKPFLNASFDTDLYFDLWKNKVDYLVTDEEVLLRYLPKS